MARKLRVQYEGAIYQVMNRGDHREDIFRDGKDRQLFLHILGQASAKTDWQIHVWSLMRNHFHLVVETPKANLVGGMKWFLGTYTSSTLGLSVEQLSGVPQSTLKTALLVAGGSAARRTRNSQGRSCRTG